MKHTELPLTTRSVAICLISQTKAGLSSLALARQIWVSYPMAWLLRDTKRYALRTSHGSSCQHIC